MRASNQKERKITEIENSIECIILGRINRFVVDITIGDTLYRAYINNTGRLSGYLIRGKKGFCIKNEKPRKTDYRLFSIRENALGAIIDTQLQMKNFERALEARFIPWLRGCRILRRNPRLGRSLIDYLLECDGEPVYVEVKSAVLRKENYAMYPDCPSSRGRRQIRDLTNHVEKGGKAMILFIAALPEVEAFKPNRDADPEMYKLLLEAHRSGVEMKSIGLHYSPEDSSIYLFNPDLEVIL